MADDGEYQADDGELRSNAWLDGAAVAPRGAEFDAWGLTGSHAPPKQLLAPAEVDPGNWQDPAIGYGVILPESGAPSADKALALDAPDCVRALVAARGNAPVFRYDPTLPDGVLRRYAKSGAHADVGITGARGVGDAAIPKFLVIIGSPKEVPWAVQYRLQLDAAVGRLDLEPAGLERYIEALLGDWSGATVEHTTPVVWAVDHGAKDITRLMRKTIADRLAKAFVSDAEFAMDGGVLSDATSTHAALQQALHDRRPAFITTSSHGRIHPITAGNLLGKELGVPIDADSTTMDLTALTTNGWSPHGVTWYAHACCSAGCGDASNFTGIAPATSSLGQALEALGALGARTAPLPQLLLGGKQPARAFVGHVEPTFDWTLRDTRNGQVTTAHIIDTFYNQLHRASRPPIGLAMQGYHRAVGGLWREVANQRDAMNKFTAGATDAVRRLRLIASDLEAMVLLGDPTVRVG